MLLTDGATNSDMEKAESRFAEKSGIFKTMSIFKNIFLNKQEI